MTFDYKGRKVEIKRREPILTGGPFDYMRSAAYEVWTDDEYADRCRATEHEAIDAAHKLIDEESKCEESLRSGWNDPTWRDGV